MKKIKTAAILMVIYFAIFVNTTKGQDTLTSKFQLEAKIGTNVYVMSGYAKQHVSWGDSVIGDFALNISLSGWYNYNDKLAIGIDYTNSSINRQSIEGPSYNGISSYSIGMKYNLFVKKRLKIYLGGSFSLNHSEYSAGEWEPYAGIWVLKHEISNDLGINLFSGFNLLLSKKIGIVGEVGYSYILKVSSAARVNLGLYFII
jgi:hypothetical protein